MTHDTISHRNDHIIDIKMMIFAIQIIMIVMKPIVIIEIKQYYYEWICDAKTPVII